MIKNINLNSILSSIKSILCLNGVLPSQDIFHKGVSIIAVDGAGSNLLESNIIPDIVIGDFDSSSLDKFKKKDIEVVITPDQNFTDFEKALDVLDRMDLLPSIVYGVYGKELDHFLYNLHVLAKKSKDYPILFNGCCKKDHYSIIAYGNITGQLPIDSTMSLLPFYNANVSTNGLCWDLKQEDLSYKTKSSIRNKVRSKHIEINTHNGCLLVTFQLFK